MSGHDRTYAVFLVADLDTLTQEQQDNLFSVAVGSRDSQRLCNNSTEMVIAWLAVEGTPPNLDILTHTQYDHTGIKALMKTAPWKHVE
jgi:beta-lactamase superfamily II metal-dependent hydrolase